MKHTKPSIDISKSVMQRIERDGIRMRSKSYFTIIGYIKKVLLVFGVILSTLGILSLTYVLLNDTFFSYRNLFERSEFVKTLPWAGIIITSASILGVIVLLRQIKKTSPSFRLSYAVGAWLILLIGAIGIASTLAPENTPAIIARTAYLSDKDPTKLSGEVIEILDSSSLKLAVNGQILVVVMDTNGIKPGDKLTILGDRKNETVYVHASMITDKAPEKTVEKKVTEKKTESKPKPVEPKPEPEQTVATKPVEPTTTSQPQTPKPEPEPKSSNTISYTLTPYPDSMNPDKYIIEWTSNFNTITGWKLPYVSYSSTNNTPSYPTNYTNYQYYEYPGIATTGINYGTAKFHKSSLGPGKFNIRICAYDTNASTVCFAYSSIITIQFYP